MAGLSVFAVTTVQSLRQEEKGHYAEMVGWSALQLTPFAYAHYSIPIHELAVIPLLVLTGIAVALTWLGFIGFRRCSLY
ncbi:MAG: hypothetical protein JJT76_04960 [Clostridiaceae bacterium]|nr:hypothetical protein [Clostridiaceae bacterium]